MVIDSSALLALLLAEPEAERIARAIASDPRRLVSAFSALETAVAIEARKGELAGLNIGDCSSYALSKFSGEPLLFKGEGFRGTDVAAVVY